MSSIQENTRNTLNTLLSNQYVKPRHMHGIKCLYCAFCHRLSHNSIDQATQGVLRRTGPSDSRVNTWFCSAYCSNAHMHENGQCHFEGLGEHIEKTHSKQIRYERAKKYGISK